MPIRYSTAVRNAMLDAFETTVGASPRLRILTGAEPAGGPSAAQTGTLLVDIPLPADWMAAASGGTKSLQGTWQAAASGNGTAGYYRILDSAGSTCHEQGTVTATGGGGDLTLDNTSIAASQSVTITTFTRTAPNA